MNNKKLIRLTESDLHRIVKESVNNVLNEINAQLPYGDSTLPPPFPGSEDDTEENNRRWQMDFDWRNLQKQRNNMRFKGDGAQHMANSRDNGYYQRQNYIGKAPNLPNGADYRTMR